MPLSLLREMGYHYMSSPDLLLQEPLAQTGMKTTGWGQFLVVIASMVPGLAWPSHGCSYFSMQTVCETHQ